MFWVCITLENLRNKIVGVPTSCVKKMSDLGEGHTLRNHPLSLKNHLIRSSLNILTKVDFSQKMRPL